MRILISSLLRPHTRRLRRAATARLVLTASLVAALPFVLPASAQNADVPRAFIDGTGSGWQELTETDFVDVNGTPDTWRWENGVLRTTGEPTGPYRSVRSYKNFEMVVEWRVMEPGGDSGIFVWVPWQGFVDLPSGEVPRYAIQAQILDHGFVDAYRARTGEEPAFATTHGDVMSIGESSFIPFPPLSPNGSRSFPSKQLSRGAGQWNHYYIRAINGEFRLWVNGEEVSGGNQAHPAEGHFFLEAAGTPVEFRSIRVRELP